MNALDTLSTNDSTGVFLSSVETMSGSGLLVLFSVFMFSAEIDLGICFKYFNNASLKIWLLYQAKH